MTNDLNTSKTDKDKPLKIPPVTDILLWKLEDGVTGLIEILNNNMKRNT